MDLPSMTVVEKGLKHCPMCGKASLIAKCPKCDSPIVVAEQRYCVGCGAHLVREHKEL
jgi:predicted RNA-binding Zn-ribbon protein involved in translation (DUF1610 family)